MWKNVFLFSGFPVLILGSVSAFVTFLTFVTVDGTQMPYDHLRVRNKIGHGGVS